jgi:hypothetical protein
MGSGNIPHYFFNKVKYRDMNVLEQRFLEQVPHELHKLNENLETLINIIKSKDNGTDS